MGKALEIRTAVFGERHTNVALTQSKLGSVLRKMGEYDQAKGMYESVLTILTASAEIGPDHLEVGDVYNKMGILYDRMGQYTVAGDYYRKALNIRERWLGPDHVAVGETMNDLAVALYHNGHYGQALTQLQEAIDIKIRAVSTRQHPTVAYSLYRMGDVLRKQGDGDGALETYNEALGVQIKTLSETHPDVASTCNSIAAGRKSKQIPLATKILLEDTDGLRRPP